MQNTYNFLRGMLGLAALLFFATGCLPVQPDFEFDSGIVEVPTFEDQTVFEWITSEASTPLDPQDGFDTLVRAIQITGLQEEYNDPSDRRTFLLLNNQAFTANGRIFRLLGITTLDTLAAEKVERLRTILLYHIVDAYVDQGPDALPVVFEDYLFQTLIPGDDGRISFHRDERFRLNLNRSIVFPESARRSPRRVHRHNYVFKNGIGHHVNNYVRIRPF